MTSKLCGSDDISMSFYKLSIGIDDFMAEWLVACQLITKDFQTVIMPSLHVAKSSFLELYMVTVIYS